MAGKKKKNHDSFALRIKNNEKLAPGLNRRYKFSFFGYKLEYLRHFIKYSTTVCGKYKKDSS